MWNTLTVDEEGNLTKTDNKRNKRGKVNATNESDSDMDEPTPRWAHHKHVKEGARSSNHTHRTVRPAVKRGGVKRGNPIGNDPKRIRRETRATTVPGVRGTRELDETRTLAHDDDDTNITK